MADEEFLRDKIKTAYGLSASMDIFLSCFPLIFLLMWDRIFYFALTMSLGFLTGGIAGLIIYAISWKNLFSPKLGDLKDSELMENIKKYRKKVKPLIATLILGIVLYFLSDVLSSLHLIEILYYYVLKGISYFIALFSVFVLILGTMLKISLKEFHSEVDIVEID